MTRARLGPLAGAVLFAYLVFWMVELASLDVTADAFGDFQEASASLAGRLVACGVLLAAVYHCLEGIRRAFPDEQPATDAQPTRPIRAPVPDYAADELEDQLESFDHAVVTARSDASLFWSATIAFTTWAIVLPCWVVLLRPWIQDLGS